jgi:hypothetical protein
VSWRGSRHRPASYRPASGVVTIYFLLRREDARALLTELGADSDFIPEDEYLTDDDFFETPEGPACWLRLDREGLDDLLYREPCGDDPGGWLRRPLNAPAKAQGLSRATSWGYVEDQRPRPKRASDLPA